MAVLHFFRVHVITKRCVTKTILIKLCDLKNVRIGKYIKKMFIGPVFCKENHWIKKYVLGGKINEQVIFFLLPMLKVSKNIMIYHVLH